MSFFNWRGLTGYVDKVVGLEAEVKYLTANNINALKSIDNLVLELKEKEERFKSNEIWINAHDRERKELCKVLKIKDKSSYYYPITEIIKYFSVFKETIVKQREEIKKKEARIKQLEGIHLANYGNIVQEAEDE
jgi:molybdopterin converting factor small subunit